MALIIQCVKEVTGDYICRHLKIDSDSMKRAIAIAQWFYDEMARCMTILGYTSHGSVLEGEKTIVLAVITQRGPITRRNIVRAHARLSNLDGALSDLLAEGLIVRRESTPHKKGRPTVLYALKDQATTDEIDTITPPSDTSDSLNPQAEQRSDICVKETLDDITDTNGRSD